MAFLQINPQLHNIVRPPSVMPGQLDNQSAASVGFCSLQNLFHMAAVHREKERRSWFPAAQGLLPSTSTSQGTPSPWGKCEKAQSHRVQSTTALKGKALAEVPHLNIRQHSSTFRNTEFNLSQVNVISSISLVPSLIHFCLHKAPQPPN